MAGARQTVRALPISVDKQIGDAMVTSMIDGNEVDDEIVVGAIESIVRRLEPHAIRKGFEFKVHVDCQRSSKTSSHTDSTTSATAGCCRTKAIDASIF